MTTCTSFETLVKSRYPVLSGKVGNPAHVILSENPNQQHHVILSKALTLSTEY